MSGDEKNTAVVVDHQHNQYGTFQGVANYPPPQHHGPAIGFPQPVPPPGLHEPSAPPPHYYSQGYQTVPGYAVAEGRPVRAPATVLRLWPWMVLRMDHREKPGYIACTIAAVLATIAIVLGVTKGIDD
ncbi:60S ribosomal protein L18a-like isoform X1 [Hibiscus syriacus]|uniref:60S ribosomal protein L18a-like isoform X1 n=1 Tax=Hibiscus syriacus TaxID=106335 RepID=A0A6A3AU43_HIBSY|nr:60S ribosomal protein L18a-like isoform X1 [Hibiscus syriacus]